MRQRRPLLILLALLALIGAIWSYIAIATPPQQTLDQHVYALAEQIKCPVCQNESVAASSAAVSTEMRQAIRQQLQEGWSDQQVLNYFAVHYGNQILLTPPRQGFNILAWLMPVIMLLAGLGLVCFVALDWRKQARSEKRESRLEDSLEDAELEQYRAQLERELEDDDPLFGSPGLEIE